MELIYKKIKTLKTTMNAIKVKCLQTVSTLFLFGACLASPRDVDPLYYYGILSASTVSFIYHWIQEPCKNKWNSIKKNK